MLLHQASHLKFARQGNIVTVCDDLGQCGEPYRMNSMSPFALQGAAPIHPSKFLDPGLTARHEARAVVGLKRLETLWFNTGTLCNLSCRNCYIESSPTNDALVYLSLAEVRAFLDEIAKHRLPVREIGFTGGEPFMNRDLVPMIELCLARALNVLVLTNAMRPLRRCEPQLLRIVHRERLTFRVSLDHHTEAVHDAERGAGAWQKAVEGLVWLSTRGFRVSVAGRHLPEEPDETARASYRDLFGRLGIPIDSGNPAELVLFPEMDASADAPEITSDCWRILNVDPDAMMCATSRMVVKRKGENTPRIAACTLLPHDPRFDMGVTLREANRAVALNHPHCARFCVLGGASCSA